MSRSNMQTSLLGIKQRYAKGHSSDLMAVAGEKPPWKLRFVNSSLNIWMLDFSAFACLGAIDAKGVRRDHCKRL
eukprot:2806198-Amphidinium_carterae.2